MKALHRVRAFQKRNCKVFLTGKITDEIISNIEEEYEDEEDVDYDEYDEYYDDDDR